MSESEPPIKIGRFDSTSGPPNQHRFDRNAMKFFIILCGDVLLDVLRYGDRRRLTKLERIGRRLHRIIESYLGEKPFLRLDLRLIARGDTIAKIGRTGSNKWLELGDFPQFFRFNTIELYYRYGARAITEKCQLFTQYLKALVSAEPALMNDLELIHFICAANEYAFNDSTLIEHLRDELLPIFDSPRRYKFDVYYSDSKFITTDIIASILQLPQIRRCSNVELARSVIWTNGQTPGPVSMEAISNWLNRTHDEGMKDGHITQPERLLRLNGIPNVRETSDYLIKKFKEANFPMVPYTFGMNSCNDFPMVPYTFRKNSCNDYAEGVEMFTNKRTDDELLVSPLYTNEMFKFDRIEMQRKKVKNVQKK